MLVKNHTQHQATCVHICQRILENGHITVITVVVDSVKRSTRKDMLQHVAGSCQRKNDYPVIFFLLLLYIIYNNNK